MRWYEVCDDFVSKWPSYGKVHTVVYCYAYFAFNDITEGTRDDLWIFKKAGLSGSKETWKKYYTKIYDTHLNLAGNDFVMYMYRLIHINRSQYVFVT